MKVGENMESVPFRAVKSLFITIVLIVWAILIFNRIGFNQDGRWLASLILVIFIQIFCTYAILDSIKCTNKEKDKEEL